MSTTNGNQRNPNPGSGGGHGGLYFIVGALVVAVVVLGYFILGGSWPPGSDGNIDVDVTLPSGNGESGAGGDSGGGEDPGGSDGSGDDGGSGQSN